MINIENITLLDLLPKSVKKDPTIVAISKSLDKYMKENIELRKRLNFMHRIDEIEDGRFLDALAYQFHVDFYDHTLSLEKKRKLIKSSIPQHKKKGTPAAVEGLITNLFGSGEVHEWFEYGGKPYFFKIMVDISAFSDGLDIFFRALDTVKNTRSHLEEFIGKKDTTLQLETNYKEYPISYPMCGTFKCGTKPYVQNQGISISTGLNVNTNKIQTSQKYKMTGTFRSGEAKL